MVFCAGKRWRTMEKFQQGGSGCFVAGCTNEHSTLFKTLSAKSLRSWWLDFIFEGCVPTGVPKLLYVCAHLFTQDCLANKGQLAFSWIFKSIEDKERIGTVRVATTNVEAVGF